MSPVEAQVNHIRALLDQRQFVQAHDAAADLLRQVPENCDALYMQAVSLRYLNRIADALAVIERLQFHHPRFSRLFQERGNCYIALKDAPRATEAFLTAVNMNAALHASWAKLELLYRMAGNTANAATAADHVATLKRLPGVVVAATALFSDGELSQAEAMIRDYLLKVGDDVEAMRLLARIGIAREVYDDAEILLSAVLEIVPNYDAARFDYARVLIERRKPEQAIAQLQKLLDHESGNRQYKTLYATAMVGVGDHARALELYRQLLTEAPQAAELHLSIAHSLKTRGETEQAIESYRAAAAARPDFGDAYWSLANLKTYRFGDAELDHMRSAESSSTISPVDRYHLCFALGKALEDRGEFADSYGYYERGNALKRKELHYRPEPVELNTRQQIETCTRELFACHPESGHDSNAPIFIVGLPRAGSTLLEQILASHSGVEGTHELADIPRMAAELQSRDFDPAKPRYPGILATLPDAELRYLGNKYLADTQVYRSGKPRFIDKMPNNFRHLGLIHLILPNAKIIDARREPMACCFSNFKQLFASGQEFTYSITDIARYYRTYLELMRHWDRVLPGQVLRIFHEDVVDDLAGSVRRLLDFCDLEFEPACMEFHKTSRNVRTASSEQVRKPIYREGLDQWRHFEPWLAELESALGDATHRYRST